MPDVIEIAKSSRSVCRTCRQTITKGEPRFGEEAPNTFGDGGTTHLWHHLGCAAKKKAAKLREALAGFPGEIPDRAALDAAIAENEPKQKPHRMPYAERASTGRSRCNGCHEAIEKGELRVATEREPEASGMSMGAPRYWHARCAKGAEIPELFEKLRANSKGLAPEDIEEIGKLESVAGDLHSQA